MNVKRMWATGLVGAATVVVTPVWAGDTDNDGMDDAYESFFGLNPATNDAALDPDGDGLNNLAESLLGTDPFVADTDRDGFLDAADSNAISRALIPWGDPSFTRTNGVVYVWPDWMVAAFKSGGSWDTNVPAWHVANAETNEAGLNIEVDRTWLTNNLAMKLQLSGSAGAALYLDLYDTNGLIIVTNLLDNLLSGTGSIKTFSIPLETNLAAVGLWLRHGTGDVTVSEALLYIDQDGDGLDADQERQLGTSDLSLDSDQDGVRDDEEVRRGTDPANAASKNTVLYADSGIGNDGYDGLSATISGGHGPKATLGAVMQVACSGDTIRAAADDYMNEGGVLALLGKNLRLTLSGQVRIR